MRSARLEAGRSIVALATAASSIALASPVFAQTRPSDEGVMLEPIPVAGRGPRGRHPGRSVAFGGIAPGLLGYGMMAFVTGMTSIDPICSQSAGGYLPVFGPLIGMIASRDCPNYGAVFAPDFVSFVLQAVAVPMIVGGVVTELRSRGAQRTAWTILPMNPATTIGLSLAWSSR